MRKGCPHVFLGAFFKDLFSCFLKSSLFHVFQQEQEVYSHVFQKHSIIEQVPSLELSFCVFQEQLLCCFLGALMCSCVCMHSMCACTHRCLLAWLFFVLFCFPNTLCFLDLKKTWISLGKFKLLLSCVYILFWLFVSQDKPLCIVFSCAKVRLEKYPWFFWVHPLFDIFTF